MGLAGQNQVRHIHVGQAVDHANQAALEGGSSADLTVFSADGGAVAAGGDFKLFQLGADGVVISSDTIKASNVLDARSVAHVAAVNKVVTISSLTVDANTLYTVKIEISGHGSLSPEDTYLKQGSYKAASGDDQEAIVDGLIVSLNRNFSREVGATASTNPYFTFSKTGTGATAALLVTGKAYTTGFDGDKRTKIYDDFSVDISCETYPTVAVTTAANPGVGTGYQVLEMEHYLLGERGDFYREMGYPHNIAGPGLNASAASSYNFVEISYYDEGRDEAKKSKKTLTIASVFTNLAGNAALNTLIADLNTILGAGTVDALATA